MKIIYIIIFILLFISFDKNISAKNYSKNNKRVLYIGDSLSFRTFGHEMDKGLKKMGFEPYLSITGGSSPYYFVNSTPNMSCSIGYWEKNPKRNFRKKYIDKVPKLETLLEKIKPTLVVLQTGTNLYATLRSKRRPQKQNVYKIQSMVSELCNSIKSYGADSYWIMPPDSHDKKYPKWLQNELANIIKKVVRQHSGYFESHKVTKYTAPYPKFDGIHYSPSEYYKWSRLVLKDLNKFVKKKKILSSRFRLFGDKDTDRFDEKKIASTINSNQSFLNNDTKSKFNDGNIFHINEEIKNKSIDESLLNNSSLYEFDISKKPIELSLELVKKSTIENINEVTYKRAFAIYSYKVLDVIKGTYPYKEIRVAHMVVINNKFTKAGSGNVGREVVLNLVPLDFYPSLKTVQIFDDLPINFSLPLYIPNFQ